jgi:hypothetical protein
LKKIFFGFPEELFPDVAKATAKLEQFIEQQKLVDKILRETKG